MRCEDCQKLVIDSLYNELDGEKRAAFEEHLTSCRECADAYLQMQATLRVMDSLHSLELSFRFLPQHTPRLVLRETAIHQAPQALILVISHHCLSGWAIHTSLAKHFHPDVVHEYVRKQILSQD